MTLHLLGADRLFDGSGAIVEHAGIAWRADQRETQRTDQIVAVGPWDALLAEHHNADAIYHPGCTLLPGLIDAHTHLTMPGTGVDILSWSAEPDAVLLLTALRNCDLALRVGVTTLVDLGARGTLTFDLRAALERTGALAPRLLLCGRALTITGGHAWPWHGEADGADGVRQAVRRLCKEGADLIKVMVSGGGTPGTDGRRPSYTQAELDALVEEAHARGRIVVAHCTAARAIARALNAGVDVIAHAQFLAPDGSNRFDDDLAQRMARQGTYVNPTLQINRVLASDRVNSAALPPDQRARHAAWVARYPEFAAATARLHAAGVRLLCGTDCGWGYSTFDEIHLELDALVAAGIPPTAALVAATGGAADALGWGDRIGRLAPGFGADLLLVEGDPTRTITDIARVRGVWRAGRSVTGQPYLQPAATHRH